MADAYYHGIRVKQDYDEAFKWFRKAAEQGEKQAQVFLGEMYELGQGAEKDQGVAQEWHNKACGNDEKAHCLKELKKD